MYNIECQSNNRIKSWAGGQSDFSQTDKGVVMWVKTDGKVDFYAGGQKVAWGNVPFSQTDFPIDMVFSPPNNNHHGFIRNIGYATSTSGECASVSWYMFSCVFWGWLG